MATGILSEGITISYLNGATPVELTDLQEVPELGGTVDKVEVTTLADSAKRYINGIKDYGDLEFKFLYDNSLANSSYRVLRGFEEAGSLETYVVELPDSLGNSGTTFTFSGYVTTKLDSVGVSAPLTFTASIALNSDITVANPVA